MKKRIQKVLSEQGICSRRAAEALIAGGKLKVNGRVASPGDKIDEKDIITIEGRRVTMEKSPRRLYYALNKPRGYVTTLQDEKNRKCVSDLVAGVGTRLYPVGRLDLDSEGLLIMTNDGEFANLILNSKKEITKLYRVAVKPAPNEEQLVKLTSGVTLDDGYTTKPVIIRTLSSQPERATLEFSLHEGRNRQIRRMCEAVGLSVVRLKRVSIGPVSLGTLASGKYRELTKGEITAMRNAAGREG